MKLGTENKKQLVVLGVLLVIMAYFLYTNVLSGPSAPAPAPRTAASMSAAPAALPPGGAASETAPVARPSARRPGSHDSGDEWHPVYLDPNPAKRPDPARIDPTLQLDRFAKVQSVELAGGARNLFQFGAAPPAAAKTLVAAAGPEPKVHIFTGPRQPPPPAPPAPPPPPPPITLKFYGYSLGDTGKRTAYLLDGDDIFLASEGDTLKRKYKILRIQSNSILIEDLDAKRQQSVPLTEEGQG